MVKNVDKIYYSIKEVSELLDVSLPTLRYWEHEVKQLQPRTNSGRTRFYTEDDIQLIRRLIYFKSQNIPVKDWSRRLTLDDKNVDRKAAARENLLAIRAELETLRSLL